ncbi:hypothetical protein BROUX41_001751 [Berkeleyomyces rouxiae]|uniref:uncharacterized protein n=1 Tax=Berkeleyomyces rouxiae TaxID=2035830 RepID=UPI003B7E20EB
MSSQPTEVNPKPLPHTTALWAKAIPHPENASIMVPQAVAHRGFSAVYPENSMAGFRGAVEEAGAQALETDVHLSRDGVVVLAHDVNLKRCFGRTEKIHDLDFAELAKLRSLRPPHTPVPSLQELLEYLAEPQNAAIWLILDIKLHDDAVQLFEAISAVLARVPSPDRPWAQRILVGCWKPAYMALAQKYLPGLPLAHIGLSPAYAAAEVLPAYPQCSLNLALATVRGMSARELDQFADSALFLWTVNDEAHMAWAVEHAALAGQRVGGIDAVVTDDPRRFREIVARAAGPPGWQKRIGILDWVKMWLIKMAMKMVSRALLAGGWYSKVSVKVAPIKAKDEAGTGTE